MTGQIGHQAAEAIANVECGYGVVMVLEADVDRYHDPEHGARYEWPDGTAVVVQERWWALGVHRNRLEEAQALLGNNHPIRHATADGHLAGSLKRRTTIPGNRCPQFMPSEFRTKPNE